MFIIYNELQVEFGNIILGWDKIFLINYKNYLYLSIYSIHLLYLYIIIILHKLFWEWVC